MNDRITPEPLLRMLTGLWVSQTLTASVELEVYTKVAAGINTVERMADSLGTERRPVEALMNACVALQLLGKQDDLFKNTPLSGTYLVEGGPNYYGDFVKMLSERSLSTWSTLKQSVLENAPQEPTLYELFSRDSEFAVLFTRAMHSNAVAAASKLAELVDLSGYRKVLDLGGGSGIYSIMFVKKYPHLEAIVLDFPPVCQVAREYIERSGVSSQVTTMSGDFFVTPLPRDVDMVLLAQVLHSYPLEDCRRIVELARDTMGPGGLIAVVEFLLNDDRTGPLFSALFALNMVVGSERGNGYTGQELCRLLEGGGFDDVKAMPLAGPMSLLTGTRA